MKKLFKQWKIKIRGSEVLADVYVNQRSGWMAPQSVFFKYNSKWYTLAHERFGIIQVIDKTSLFFLLYFPYRLFTKEFARPSALLSKIPKDHSWSGGTFQIPIKQESTNAP